MAEMFRAAGYATAHVGKWHLGYTPETMPLARGFDRSFGHMGGCIDNFSHFFFWQGPNVHDLWRDGPRCTRKAASSRTSARRRRGSSWRRAGIARSSSTH